MRPVWHRLPVLLKVPVFVTEQNAPKLGPTVADIRAVLGDYARVFPKLMFSAVEEGLGGMAQT